MNNKTSKQGKHSKTPSSATVKENLSVLDSTVLKTNLQEFYKKSKEKLLSLKTFIQNVETENQKQKEENNKLTLQAGFLQTQNEEYALRLKGVKEKLISAQKHRNFLQTQIKEHRLDVETTTRKIDTIKIDGGFKVKMVQNDIEHIHAIKENTLKSIRAKIDIEEAFQENIKEKITDIKEEIARYKQLIDELNQPEAVRVKELQKETDDMTKFLSEL